MLRSVQMLKGDNMLVNMIPSTNPAVFDFNEGAYAGGWVWDETKDMSDANCTWGSNLTTGSGVTVSDDSSGSNDLTLDADTQWDGTNKKFGSYSLSFDGSQSADAGAHVSAGTTSTLEAWIKTSTNFGAQAVIVDTGGSRWQIWFEADDKVWCYNYDGAWQTADSNNTLNDGSWHHVAGQFTNSGELNLFIDGVKQNTTDTVGTHQDDANVCSVGAFRTASMYCYTGNIDEFCTSDIIRYT